MERIKDCQKRLLLLLLVSALLFGGVVVFAQSEAYDLGWYTVAGGGGSSSSRVYTLGASIAQPAAGSPLQGSEYTLYGGFWSGVAQPGAVVSHSVWLPVIFSSAGGVDLPETLPELKRQGGIE